MRKEVSLLIEELREACRRPLFQEVALFNKTYHEQQLHQQIHQHNHHRHSKHGASLKSPLATTTSDPQLFLHDAFETASQASSTATSAALAGRFGNKRNISGSSGASPKTRNSLHHRKRRWDELLHDAAKLSIYMNRSEHALVSRLASILLLGFLLPHSTGNEFFLTQHASTSSSSASSSSPFSTDRLPLVLELPLEERLEHGSMFYSTSPTPPGRCTDAHLDLVFWVFLQQLATYVQATSWFLVDHDQVDLLHILAMAIDAAPAIVEPTLPPQQQSSSSAAAPFHHKGIARAHQLMKSLVPHSFYLPYGHRRFLVKLVGHDFVLPRQLGKDDSGDDYNESLSPWMEGAIYHLRASLSSYAMSSVSFVDAHAAHLALANLTIQTMTSNTQKKNNHYHHYDDNIFPTPDDEWNRCLARMVDDRGHYNCTGTCFQQGTNHCCPHAARGKLLDNFLCRVAQQQLEGNDGSSHEDDDDDHDESRHHQQQFLVNALSSLADAVEWQVDCWTAPSSSSSDEKAQHPRDSACLLASLLHSAKSLFYFWKESHHATEHDHDDDDDEEEIGEQEAAKTSLLQSAIQLVHHPDQSVANQASILVSLAFALDKDLSGGQQLLLETVKAALSYQVTFLLEEELGGPTLVPMDIARKGQMSMISTAAYQSRSFASSLLLFLISKRRDNWKSQQQQQKSTDDKVAALVARWIVTVCQAQPWVSLKYRRQLLDLFQEEQQQQQQQGINESQSHLLAAILASRLAYFFNKPESDAEVGELVFGWLKQSQFDNWKALQMARHCLITGNFSIANRIYEHLMQFSVSEQSFLWLSTLMKIAQAEVLLENHATKGIPAATIELQAAVSNLVTLQSLDAVDDGCFQFLITFLRLRLDFLDLIAALRFFIREMRLTGSGPVKYTRSAWHVQNIPHCFERLSHRYHRLYRQYGLFFQSQQSRTALRTIQASCHFVADVSRKVFAETFGDVVVSTNNKRKEGSDDDGRRRHCCSGDTKHPMTILTRKLEELVIRDMSSSVDPMTRAAATLEAMDGLLMTPIPFPRDLRPPLPLASLRLTADPEQAMEMTTHNNVHTSDPVLKVIEAFPRLSFKFLVNGSIPSSFATRATIPFFTFMCWYTIVYTGPLQGSEQEETPVDEKHDEDDGAATDGSAVAVESSLADWNMSSSEPLATPISPSMKFFLSVECPPLFHEGQYLLTVRPLLRDIRGGEWILSVVNESDLSIPIRVSRSRDLH